MCIKYWNPVRMVKLNYAQVCMLKPRSLLKKQLTRPYNDSGRKCFNRRHIGDYPLKSKRREVRIFRTVAGEAVCCEMGWKEMYTLRYLEFSVVRDLVSSLDAHVTQGGLFYRLPGNTKTKGEDCVKWPDPMYLTKIGAGLGGNVQGACRILMCISKLCPTSCTVTPYFQQCRGHLS